MDPVTHGRGRGANGEMRRVGRNGEKEGILQKGTKKNKKSEGLTRRGGGGFTQS